MPRYLVEVFTSMTFVHRVAVEADSPEEAGPAGVAAVKARGEDEGAESADWMPPEVGDVIELEAPTPPPAE